MGLQNKGSVPAVQTRTLGMKSLSEDHFVDVGL